MKGKAEQRADIAFTVLLAVALLGHGRAILGRCCWNHSNSLLWGRTATRVPHPSRGLCTCALPPPQRSVSGAASTY